MDSKINRRQLLKNSVLTVSVTMYSSNVLANNSKKVKNVIFFYVPNGAPKDKWAPEMVDGQMQLNICTQPYKSVKNRCVFFNDLTTFGSERRALDGLSFGISSNENIIESLVNERLGKFPLDLLQLSGSDIISNGQINKEEFILDPWEANKLINESTNTPYIEMLNKNIEYSIALLNKTSGLDSDEVNRYKDMLNKTSEELSARNGSVLEIPFKNDGESLAKRTDYQLINAVSAIKAKKTSVIHFMTGDFNFQQVLNGEGDYHSQVHNGPDNYSLHRTAFDQKVSDLISLLEETEDELGEPLIESTLVVLYSNEGDGDSHNILKAPYLLAGGSFLNGGKVNNTKSQLEFIDTIIALTGSKLPYVSIDGPLTELIG